MNLDHLRNVFPATNTEWREWVSAGRTRNWMLHDSLLDWLNLYGADHGFVRDDAMPGYDARYDFTSFVMRQGRAFEAAVLAHLRGRFEIPSVADGWEDIRSLEKGRETYDLMRAGAPFIHQGVLFDAATKTYGAPDLLVRSDHLAQLFPEALTPDDAAIAAIGLSGGWHYRVVDIKFTTLHLTAGGSLANMGSAPAYKAQLFLYNQALGALQGYTPPAAYLLGRGWQQTTHGVPAQGDSCFERLAPVEVNGEIQKAPLAKLAGMAVDWMRRVRAEGHEWRVSPDPSVRELWPNMAHGQDGPWHHAKLQIARDLDDVTLLWRAGPEQQANAHRGGVTRWTDPRCTPALLGLTGERTQPVLHELLRVNREPGLPPVLPDRIRTDEAVWRVPEPLEFFVDFETVSDLYDDFRHIPQRGGQPLIFMIGCGHMEDGEWQFRCFIAHALTEEAEAAVIDDWLTHMEAVRQRLAPQVERPLVFHWSQAEVSNFESAYNSAVVRHPERSWPSPNWYDYLGQVMRVEPVVVRGSLAFGLKAVAKAMHSLGLIHTNWADGLGDGLSAMVAAWWCSDEAATAETGMDELPLMQEIARYNEIDCRVMQEIIQHLRNAH